jgi:RHS repeat-associated protein
MERDGEGFRYYDHARMDDFFLSRFNSPDKVGGTAEQPQSWNRYSYGASRPLMYLDPDGQAIQLSNIVSQAELDKAAALRERIAGFLGAAAPTQDPRAVLARSVVEGMLSAFLPRDFSEVGQNLESGLFALVSPLATPAAQGLRLTKHAVDQIINRELAPKELLEALRGPILRMGTKFDQNGRPSIEIIREGITLVVNTDGRTITIHRTHRRLADVLKKRLKDFLAKEPVQ